MQSISEIFVKMYMFLCQLSHIECLCDKLVIKSERDRIMHKNNMHPLCFLVDLHGLMLQLLQDQVLFHLLV